MQSKYNDTKDCSLCKPALLPANVNAWQVYLLVKHQWNMGGMDGAVVSIQYPSIWVALELECIYERYERKDVFEKVVYLSGLDIAKMAKARKAEYDKMKSKSK